MTERLMIKDSDFSALCIHEQDFVESLLSRFIEKLSMKGTFNKESVPAGKGSQ